jgi:hypothetical protein
MTFLSADFINAKGNYSCLTAAGQSISDHLLDGRINGIPADPKDLCH